MLRSLNARLPHRADRFHAQAVCSGLPCDYADASLIWPAETTRVLQIATIAEDDFTVYRVRGRRAFRILIGA